MLLMQNYIHLLLAFLVISTLIVGESEAGNETNDDNSDDNDSNETNDDNSDDNDSNETNDDNSDDNDSNETNDDNGSNETNEDNNTSSGNNETNEQSGFCPAEITEENEGLVDDVCVVPTDETEESGNDTDEGFLPSLSFVVSICAIAIIAFRRR